MKFRNLSSVTLLISLTVSACSQPSIVKLWPNGVPNSIPNANYRERVIKSWGRDCYAGVTDPELQVFPAPEEKSTGTVVIICPGGAYHRIAFAKEGNPAVEWLNEHGITAIILKYRLPSDSIMVDKSIGPLQDAQEAVRIVRRNAATWNIDPSKIGIMGFSAGGHLASTLCTHFQDTTYAKVDATSARPDFAILIYPVISMTIPLTHLGSRINLLGETPDSNLIMYFSNEYQVSRETPQTFLVHSADDQAVPVGNSVSYFTALQKNNVKCELHIYQQGGHGYGLPTVGNTEIHWPEACINWLKANGLL